MKNILILIILGVGAFKGYQYFSMSKVAPLHDSPYIAVYGRDTCGYTQATLRELDQAGISYSYYSVDNREVADVLHKRMESSGINTRRYLLPVVDLNNDFEIRPDNGVLIKDARSLLL